MEHLGHALPNLKVYALPGIALSLGGILKRVFLKGVVLLQDNSR